MLTLIKNKKGRIVSTSPERKKYLLNPNPVALKVNGQPKEDQNGRQVRIIKSRDEEGWTDVTPEEVRQYEADLSKEQEEAEEIEDAQRAATLATATAAKLAQKVSTAGQKNAAGKMAAAAKKKKEEDDMKAGQQAAADSEAKVREAENDPAKYDALNDEEKAKYLELFEKAPEGSK